MTARKYKRWKIRLANFGKGMFVGIIIVTMAGNFWSNLQNGASSVFNAVKSIPNGRTITYGNQPGPLTGGSMLPSNIHLTNDPNGLLDPTGNKPAVQQPYTPPSPTYQPLQATATPPPVATSTPSPMPTRQVLPTANPNTTANPTAATSLEDWKAKGYDKQFPDANKYLPTPTPTPSAVPGQYASLWAKEMTKHPNLPSYSSNLIINSENQGQNPMAINRNSNGTVDVGLGQVNADPKDVKEVQRLQNDPAYNIQKSMEKLDKFTGVLGDPVLGLAAYNMGPTGALRDPVDAIKRAQWVYYKAGIQMPQTPFTQNPQAFISAQLSRYKSLGLVQ